ncbi:hypothetical protein COLO4_34970 [Corchorus olitorius]|uniref:RING-type E3 ubiquitin transferase n=1 Tax=Corchorus olitorius TaxID=93759 RepID=A0A1R3GIN9_9ROSI|nr:hypothetical protein COLO4_34970 [Corchorus olitorius]
MSQTHGKLGPFLLGKDMEAAGGSVYDNIKLIFLHVKCEQDTTSLQTGGGNAKVSALLRAFPKESLQDIEASRTGLSGLTLTAEGIWNSSSGQLLMVGCEGRVESGLEGCDYQIAMYFPRAVSIKQRSFLFGSISSLKKDIGLDNPLFFDAMRSSNDFLDSLSYSYSNNIDLVNRFERTTLPHQILTFIKQLLFQYPALKDGEEPLAQLVTLASSLGLHGYVVSDQLIDGQKSRVIIQIEVLSLGPLLLQHHIVPQLYKRNQRNEPVVIKTKEDLKISRFLNVSMHLVFRIETTYQQTTYKNVSELSLEGLYDPTLGEMHLIGCRKALVEGIGLERGQDCLIEVKIQYPAKNFQWKKHQSAKITIRSQRQEEDPLHFNLISLSALLTHYQDYDEIALNREAFEGILCILMLAGSIAIIWSQLLYMKADASIVPYISTSMLASQILGYSLPLICGAKVLLKPSKLEAYYGAWPQSALGMLKLLQSIQNALLLVAILVTARLFRMVSKSRKRHHPKGSRYAATKIRVILGFIVIFAVDYLIWLATRENPNVHVQPGKDNYEARNVHMQQTWMPIIEDVVSLLQDMFLLPQILLNLSMATPVKSLREAYYLGFTSIRLLVHFLDYTRDPVLHPKVGISEFMSQNSTSALFAKVAAPAIIIMTAIVVYIQQNWKYQKHMIHSPKY